MRHDHPRLPMRGRVGSLNAAASLAAVLYAPGVLPARRGLPRIISRKEAEQSVRAGRTQA